MSAARGELSASSNTQSLRKKGGVCKPAAKRTQSTGVSDERKGKQSQDDAHCYTLHSFTNEQVGKNNRRHI